MDAISTIENEAANVANIINNVIDGNDGDGCAAPDADDFDLQNMNLQLE